MGCAVAGLAVLLLVDLYVLHRGAGVISMRDAAWSTAGFIAISIAFGIVLFSIEGRDVGAQLFAGYLLEKSPSLGRGAMGKALLRLSGGVRACPSP